MAWLFLMVETRGFEGRDIISIRDLDRADLENILKQAAWVEGRFAPPPKTRAFIPQIMPSSGLKAASLFFEPSTRTRVSTELALEALGVSVNGFAGIEGTSVKKGEPLHDTLLMFRGYGDNVVFMRHPLEGSARYAAEVLDIPLVNCGDGANQHPTQTILDLYTIQQCQGKIDGLTVALVGDLKYGRTKHSLLMGLSKFKGINVLLVCPDALKMSQSYIDYFKKMTGREPVFEPDLEKALGVADIVYMTRIQKERFPDTDDGRAEFQRFSGIYRLTRALIEKSHPKANMRIMHPLPRFKERLEIDMDVDGTPYAYYFEQAQNGFFARVAVSGMILGLLGQDCEYVGEKEKPDFQRIRAKDMHERAFTRDFYRLENGTLIDHLEVGNAGAVLRALGIDTAHPNGPVIRVGGLPSRRYAGGKDVVGISGRELDLDDMSLVALVSDRATINYIRDGKVDRKLEVSAPKEVKGLVACTNAKCITYPGNYEHVPTRFVNLQESPDDPLKLRCAYCEKEVSRGNIQLVGSS